MSAPHVYLNYTIEDAKGESSSFRVNFPDSTDIAILKTFAGSTAAMIDDLIKGRITDISIGMSVSLPSGIKTAADSTSDVQEGARFNWRTALGTLTQFRIPTFDEAYITAGTSNVDTGSPGVGEFRDRIISGQTVGLINVSPSDDRGESITALDSARESFTKSRG